MISWVLGEFESLEAHIKYKQLAEKSSLASLPATIYIYISKFDNFSVVMLNLGIDKCCIKKYNLASFFRIVKCSSCIFYFHVIGSLWTEMCLWTCLPTFENTALRCWGGQYVELTNPARCAQLKRPCSRNVWNSDIFLMNISTFPLSFERSIIGLDFKYIQSVSLLIVIPKYIYIYILSLTG